MLRFNQDTCASKMFTAANLYKRTDNLSKSAPRMTSDWEAGFRGGQPFDVPLHDNDKEYRTVTTGLVKVQPDRANKGLVDWINTNNDTDSTSVGIPG